MDTVARLRCDAFFVGADRSFESDAAGLLSLLGGDGYELALVADVNGVVAGSVLFIRRELEPAHDLTPWLAGLVVEPTYRRRGIGQSLVRAVEAYAWGLGVARLHLYTNEAESFYATLGWAKADRFVDDGVPMALMVRSAN